jgi:hypothetical protein
VDDDCKCIGFIYVVYSTCTLRLLLSSQTKYMEYMLLVGIQIKFAKLSYFWLILL